MFSFLCRKLLRYVWRQTMDVFSPIQVTQSVILLLSKFHIVRTLSLWSWSILLMPCISPLTYVFVLLCVCVCVLFCFISSVLMDVHWWSSVSNFDHQSYSLALFLQDSFHSNRMLLSMPNPQCFTFVLFQYIFRRRLKFTQFVVQNKLANQTFAEWKLLRSRILNLM